MSVACIIPTHGRPSDLRRALDSVASQIPLPNEIIVVDDMNDEPTKQVVDSFQGVGPTVRLVRPGDDTVRRSAGTSRNLGASVATSEFLAFLDDDDYWAPNYLSAVAGVLESSEVPLVFAALSVVNNGNEVGRRLPDLGLKDSDVVSINPGVTGSNITIAADLFRQLGGYDEDLPVYNDLDFLLRCLETGAAYGVAPTALAYQVTSGAEHLSSRSARRAAGIAKYRDKYRHRLQAADSRRLRRDIAVANRFHDQRPHLKAAYLVITLINSDLLDILRFLKRVSTKRTADYG
ncbi:glycosyltransferase family 2 protein [Paenarthrobacter nitroguajacolicus]|uniref:glycosyltransferase family 2 protein n=1 Tax=Paenarthrobacter nitroguajacolicus TaxID=211146 RepID=UPI00248ADCE1|nr:glycosyltransferase [Paenarthrobacter nitroguajacolicus]